MDTLHEGLYTFFIVSVGSFWIWILLDMFLENIKRNISCSLTSIENCAVGELIDKTS